MSFVDGGQRCLSQTLLLLGSYANLARALNNNIKGGGIL